ncbi:hypothetical protein BGZ65_004557 [Modicella reniformis]|uniref:Pentacotripeptide-repeat region of PRORP domain-containing protein n=1 Tax=Modicella reniformis TaxID=1440133 RepID=A0A9P6LYV0_9FUNG|nr:hypothetical protein BGZ65_004557 [Modicella reniformis]
MSQSFPAALFSTSSSQASSSKEEEDLYQALTASFRTRLAEQIHRPEDGYKAVIEHWTAHAQKDNLGRQRTKVRKGRLAAAIEHKDIARIQREHERLEFEANGTSDDHFYIIQAWIKCGELKRATMAFEKMESLGVPLTARTLAAMTRAHSRAGNIAIAGGMVQKMRDLNLQPSSIYDLSALLEYYIKLTPTSPTLVVPASSSSSSPSPSLIISITAMNSTLKESDPSDELVNSIWRTMEPRLVLTSSVAANNNVAFSYRIYLHYLINRAQDLDRAAELIDKMTIRNVSPELERSPKTAIAIIQHLTKHGYFIEVQKLIEQKDAALAKTLPSTVWSGLMEVCLSRGENQKARWIYNDMIRHGIQPSSKCRKMFSDLQLKGGTTNQEGPEIASTGARVEEAEAETATRKEAASILSVLFNRPPKPAMSS